MLRMDNQENELRIVALFCDSLLTVNRLKVADLCGIFFENRV